MKRGDFQHWCNLSSTKRLPGLEEESALRLPGAGKLPPTRRRLLALAVFMEADDRTSLEIL